MKIIFNPRTRIVQFTRRDGSTYEEEKDSADVVDYPISEALKDSTGKPMWDDTMGTYRTTGRTLEFTLLKGQAGEFEDYVADILLSRFGFLDEKAKVGKTVKASMVGKKDIVKEPQEEVLQETEELEETAPTEVKGSGKVVKTEEGFICPECSKVLKIKAHYGIHLASKHPQVLGLE